MAFDAMLFCFGRCGTAPRLRGSENPRAAESRVKKEQEQKIELFSAMQCNTRRNAGLGLVKKQNRPCKAMCSGRAKIAELTEQLLVQLQTATALSGR